MRFIVPIIIAANTIFGQVSAASPQEDAEFITQSIDTAFEDANLIESIASTYADFLTEELGKHSVRVIDSARFKELLPVEALEPWRLRWQEIFTKLLMANYTPDQLARLVHGAQTVGDEAPEGKNPFQTDAGFYFFTVGIGFHIGSQTTVMKELRNSVSPLLSYAQKLVML